MNLILRCFRCKKQSKKNKDLNNSSNVKFNPFVNQETNLAKNINKVSLKILPLLSPKLWKALVHKVLRDFKTFTLLSPDYHVLSPKSLKGGVICRKHFSRGTRD